METILTTIKNQTTKITLNRPKAINAINLTMVEELKTALTKAENSDTKVIIIDGAGERGLSGGGDIKEMAANQAQNATEFIQNEYELDLAIANAKKPVIAIMSGITMGGGIGISGHATLRIVTETSRLAMPETKIGITPDVGGNLILAKSPGRLGEYLALTAKSFNAHDAIFLGFADVFIEESKIAAFLNAVDTQNLDKTSIFEIANSYATKPQTSVLATEQEWIDTLIDKTFEKAGEVSVKTVTEAGAMALADWAVNSVRLLIHTTESSGEAEHVELSKTLRGMSPTSLAVSIAQLARTRALNLTLKEVLADDLRVLSKLFEKADFVEGVRALVIDKDNKPAWQPATIEDLDATEIAKVLDPS